MRSTSLFLSLLLVAGVASAQTFEIGPRVSNYSSHLDTDFLALRTGRVSSYGLVGSYQNGGFVLDWMYDHDPQNGISLTDVIIDVGDYERDRGEATVGYRILPGLDLQGGVRLDDIRVGGISFLGNSIANDLSIEHQAIVAGAKLHTPTGGPASFYILGRGMMGNAKFRDGFHEDADTTGYRAEAGIPIRLGQSNWFVVPGAEYEHIEAKDIGFRLNTNRAFLNFVYSTRP